MRNRPRLLLLAVIVLIIAVAVLITLKGKHSPGYTQKIVSQDTGEVAYSQPNQVPEKQAGAGNVVLFGSYLILDNGATQDQFALVKQAVTQYSNRNLHNQYDSLTILPNTFTSNAGDMKASLRQGDTDKTVHIEIKIWDLKYVRVLVKDAGGNSGGDYDSGQLKVADNPSE